MLLCMHGLTCPASCSLQSCHLVDVLRCPPRCSLCRAHGHVFDLAAFIAAHRRKDKVASFLQQFRNSQMLEVFITERLKLALEGYVTEDPFELKASPHLAAQAGIGKVQAARSIAFIRSRMESLITQVADHDTNCGDSVKCCLALAAPWCR
jgi:hypothetical protein